MNRRAPSTTKRSGQLATTWHWLCGCCVLAFACIACGREAAMVAGTTADASAKALDQMSDDTDGTAGVGAVEAIGSVANHVRDVGADLALTTPDAIPDIVEVQSAADTTPSVPISCSCTATEIGTTKSDPCPRGWLMMPVDSTSLCVPDYPVWGIGPDIPTGFKDIGNGVAFDDLTGLEWQLEASSTMALSWSDALKYCQALELGGKTDWRLPSSAELHSTFAIANLKGVYAPPPLKPNLPWWDMGADFFWSFSPFVGTSGALPGWGPNPGSAWGGYVTGVLRPYYKSELGSVRCVRGVTDAQEPQERFSCSIAGFVEDSSTGLLWRTCAPTWGKLANATADCAALNTGAGQVGWHVPTTRELVSVVFRDQWNPAYDVKMFPNILSEEAKWTDKFPYSMFWTSTTVEPNDPHQPGVDLVKGGVYEFWIDDVWTGGDGQLAGSWLCVRKK